MYYIGIDIGGTGIKAGVVNESGEVICKSSIPTEAGAEYTVLAKHIADLTLAAGTICTTSKGIIHKL